MYAFSFPEFEISFGVPGDFSTVLEPNNEGEVVIVKFFGVIMEGLVPYKPRRVHQLCLTGRILVVSAGVHVVIIGSHLNVDRLNHINSTYYLARKF